MRDNSLTIHKQLWFEDKQKRVVNLTFPAFYRKKKQEITQTIAWIGWRIWISGNVAGICRKLHYSWGLFSPGMAPIKLFPPLFIFSCY